MPDTSTMKILQIRIFLHLANLILRASASTLKILIKANAVSHVGHGLPLDNAEASEN